MDVTRPPSLDISDYLGMARRHWWIVATMIIVGAGGDTNAVGGRTRGEINLDTEAQLLESTAVASGAGELLRSTENVGDLAKRVSVEVPPNSTVLQIKFSAPAPQAAQAGSHAFAESYLHNRYNALVTPLAFTFLAYALLWRNFLARPSGLHNTSGVTG